jgi:hypothetical protein
MTDQPENARKPQPEGIEQRSVGQALLTTAQHAVDAGFAGAAGAAVTNYLNKPKDPPKDKK